MPPFLKTEQHFVTVWTNQVQQEWCSELCIAKELKTTILLTVILALIIFVSQVSSFTALNKAVWLPWVLFGRQVKPCGNAVESFWDAWREIKRYSMIPSLLNLTSHTLHPSSVSSSSRSPEPQKPGWFTLKFLTYRHLKSKTDITVLRH